MKTIVSILISFVAVVACCFVMQCNAVKASAADEVNVSCVEISAPEVAGTQAGDFRMDFSITNNTGFSSLGVGFRYDNENFYVLTNSEGGVIYTTEILAGTYLFVTDDPSQGLIGVGGILSGDTTDDGVILSVYFRRKPNPVNASDVGPLKDVEIDQFVNAEKEIVVVEETYREEEEYEVLTIETSYIIGDVNGDGEITQTDAQIVETVVDANGGYISAADFEDDVPFYEYEGVICIGVVDVDGDNDIDDDDTEEILSCYVITDVMNNTYTGVVGTTGYYYRLHFKICVNLQSSV